MKTCTKCNETFVAQDGACAVCKIPQVELKTTLHVDHDHTTGQVRALLCTNCNHALGQTKENPEILQALIDYLTQHRRPSHAIAT